MGFLLYRRFGLLTGLRLNLAASRRGITPGLSVGVPGARVAVNARGERHATVGLPGTGARYTARGNLLVGPWRGRRPHQPRTFGQRLRRAFIWGALGGLLVAAAVLQGCAKPEGLEAALGRAEVVRVCDRDTVVGRDPRTGRYILRSRQGVSWVAKGVTPEQVCGA